MEFNKYQTQLTEEFLKTIHPEVIDEFYEYVNGVPFINNLISNKRRYAKDMPKDNEGKIIIDFSNPHILEDMDYFRQTAIHYQKYGKFTMMRVNSQTHSPYMRWFREEIRRCWEGMVRESDGEWITGRMYFYLNYFPIIQTKIENKDDKVGSRIVDFPEFWEGVYWRFHYLDKARKTGKHAVEIASRGKSKSYSVASILLNILLLGENKENNKNAKSLISAYNKEYLIKDGTITKMLESLNFLRSHEEIQFPKQLLKESMSDMQWTAGWEDTNNRIKKGSGNEVLAVAIADDPDKMRGKRSIFMGYEEFGMYPKFLDTWQISFPNVQDGQIVFGLAYAIGTGGSEGCLTENNFVFLSNGDIKKISDININDELIGYDVNSQKYSIEKIKYLNTPTYKECIKITTNSLREIECSLDHPIYSSVKKDYNDVTVWDWIESKDLKIGNKVAICQEIPIFGNEELFDARLVGMLIGDGSYITSPNITSQDIEIQNYIKLKYDYSIYNSYLSKNNKIVENIGIKKIRNELRNIKIYGQSCNNKRLPDNIFRCNKDNVCDLIAGLIDTDGNINIYYNKKRNKYNCTISISSSNIELCKQIQLLLMKIGVYCNIIIKQPSKNINKKIKDINPYYSIEISSINSLLNLSNNVNLLLKYKQDKLKSIPKLISNKKRLYKNKFEYETIKKIEFIGKQKIYNLEASNTHTYLGNGIITHNSDFTGALEMIFYPKGYNVLGLPNIYDKGSTGQKETIFFFPSYINMKPFYNKDGVSDVVGAMLSELEYRRILKYNSSDPLQLTRRKAEYAFTLQDAIMRRDGTLYPVHALNERIMQIDNTPAIENKLWNGRLILENEKVKFVPDDRVKPIRNFPHKDNKNEGCVTIHKMPVLDSNGNIPWGRYIAGADTYDDDHAETLSFFSGIIMDLWTNEIVLEYTGRPMFAKEAYENWRLCLIMYNAECNYENNKKGLFQHFSQFHSLKYLSDTLDFLKEKDPNQNNNYGNKAHPYSEKIYTPNGIKKWKDINIGDYIYSSDNKLTKVINIPFDNITDIYELTLKDGRKVKASSNHLWKIIDWNNKEKILSTNDMINNYYRYKGKYKEYKYYIPKNEGVEFNKKNILINPYLLGLSIGDGCFTQTTRNQLYFTSNENDFNDYNKILKLEYKKLDDRHYRLIINNIKSYLEYYNLNDKKSRTKFIPNDYKYNTKEIRLNLLQGLMDSDGSVGYGGNPEFVTTSNQLHLDILEIARSLGINCNSNINSNEFGEIYKIRFYTNIKLFKLKRKYLKQKLTKTRNYKTAIINIKYIGKEEAKCITVDSYDNCYLINDFITTHNSKGTGNYGGGKGSISGYARMRIRDWLLEPKEIIVENKDEIDNVKIEIIPNLYTLDNRALLQELALWNGDLNTDRHDALAMLMLLREDKLRLFGSNPKDTFQTNNSDYLGNDNFFNSFDKKRNKRNNNNTFIME